MAELGPVLLWLPLVVVLDFYTTRFGPWLIRRLIRRHDKKVRRYGDDEG